MIDKSKGIVLRVVKYGETSVIVAMYTERFGLQSYLVNGVRTSSKKNSAKGNLFQPAAILDLVVYHNDLKNLQRLKEFKWAYLYQQLFFNVLKNAVALFMVELLTKSLKQPEPNSELFQFVERSFIDLDGAHEAIVANYPLFFAIHLASYLGLRIHNNYSDQKSILDLREGSFVGDIPNHPDFLEGENSHVTSQLLRIADAGNLEKLKLNQDKRRSLLFAYQTFYALHVQDFMALKTIPVLQAVLGD